MLDSPVKISQGAQRPRDCGGGSGIQVPDAIHCTKISRSVTEFAMHQLLQVVVRLGVSRVEVHGRFKLGRCFVRVTHSRGRVGAEAAKASGARRAHRPLPRDVGMLLHIDGASTDGTTVGVT